MDIVGRSLAGECFNPCCHGSCSRAGSISIRSTLRSHGFNPCCHGSCSRAWSTPSPRSATIDVSILVVMEVAQGHVKLSRRSSFDGCFNPCCHGSCSRAGRPRSVGAGPLGFNPCCHGSCSRAGRRESPRPVRAVVSILVVMEVAQGHDVVIVLGWLVALFQSLLSWKLLKGHVAGDRPGRQVDVSILVVMEVAQGPFPAVRFSSRSRGFNPCCHGSCSRATCLPPLTSD